MQHASDRPGTRTHATGGGGLVLGRYRPVRRIGSGGMGVVWLAHDEKLDRAVAVKRIPVNDETVARRAAREAKAAARLSHPAIVALHETGRDEDAVYLVSELVVGSTLAELLAEGALSDRDVLQIGAALCEALAHAHGRGVVHRDVKPQNVIVPDTRQSGAGVAKLTDFGIAMLLDEDVMTRTGDVVGTLAYMAPEQAEGREVTAQADVYALGLVVYEALSGINPVRGRTPAATVRRVGDRLPKLERLRRDLPRELCAAVDRAVDPDPRVRGRPAALRTVLRAHGAAADDAPGTVGGSPLQAVTRVSALAARRRPPAGGPGYEREASSGSVRVASPVRCPPSGRLVAALGAGGLTGVALSALAAQPLSGAVTAGVAAGLLVAALPRLGFVLALLVLCVWLVAAPAARTGSSGGSAGVVVLVLAAGLPVVLALWRARPGWWSAPALAPVLGLLALATAWPAIAGQAPRVVHRFALGALGGWWLLLAQALSGRTLLLEPVPGVPAPARWSGSLTDAVGGVLAPLITSGVLGIAFVWACAAAVLPYLVRGRVVAVDLVLAGVWATGLALGTQAVTGTLSGPGGPPAARGLVASAFLAGVIAVGARASRAAR